MIESDDRKNVTKQTVFLRAATVSILTTEPPDIVAVRSNTVFESVSRNFGDY